MPRVLIAFDGSPSARLAVDRAAELFAGDEAIVVSVVEGGRSLVEAASGARIALPDDVIRTALDRLRETRSAEAHALAEEGTRAAAAAGLRARARVAGANGSVAGALLEAARAEAADVVVCGTRGHGAVARAVLGSVASALLRSGELPMLVVPPRAERTGSGPLVLAFDGSDAAAHAVERTAALLPGRETAIVHTWRSGVRHSHTGAGLREAPMPELREIAGDLDDFFAQTAEEATQRGVALATELGLRATGSTIESAEPTAHAIMDAADELDAVAIAIGRRGRSALAGAVMGSVSSSIVHAAERPVLVVAD